MRQRERQQWMELLENERDAHRKERQELLNRIAAPERLMVDSSPLPHDPQPMSQSDQELAFIGREVPDGVNLGSLRDNGDQPS